MTSEPARSCDVWFIQLYCILVRAPMPRISNAVAVSLCRLNCIPQEDPPPCNSGSIEIYSDLNIILIIPHSHCYRVGDPPNACSHEIGQLRITSALEMAYVFLTFQQTHWTSCMFESRQHEIITPTPQKAKIRPKGLESINPILSLTGGFGNANAFPYMPLAAEPVIKRHGLRTCWNSNWRS